MKRWQKWLLGLAVVVGLTAVYLFWPQGVWPFVVNLDELAAVGDNYDVRILRDTWGVPHVFGQTDADVAYGLAYANAEDDFLTIQQTLAAARGQLGAIYGPDAAPNDYMVQLLRIWPVINAEYDAIPPDVQALMQAYADGLNHYAARHEAELLAANLFPLSGKDVAASFVHKVPLFFGLDGVLGELFADSRQNSVSGKETAVRPLEFTNPQSPISNLQPIYGSNTFAVGPGRSANGETFLAVNSHQPWEGPVSWYEAHLHSEEGWDAVGGLIPGSPTITHGHNRNLGWAFTVNSPDLVDVFVLEMNPDNPNQYRFDGEWRDLEVSEARLRVKLFGRFYWTVKRELLWSVYGPTVRQDHGVYAIRYAGMGEVGHVEQFYRMNKAANFDEWLAAMREGPLPMFNTGYADKEGNIFYLYNGRIPLRAEGYDWEQYLPGDTSETLWTDYLPFDQLPQALNPPSGFIQNANSSPFQTTVGPGNPDPAAYSPTLGIETGMSNRALRALALFGNDEAITEAEFTAYKYDMGYAPESDVARLVDILLDGPTPDDPDEQTAVSLLADWDLQATPESTETAVAMLTLHFVLESEAANVSVANMVGGELPEGVVRASFSQAVDVLVENFGRVDVPWQEVNRLVRGNVNLGLGGAPDVLHAVYGELQENGRFHGFVGDSYVLLVTWTADGTVHSRSIHQYGSATIREDSPHYADQAPLFVQRRLKPVWLDEADVMDNLEQAYAPGQE